MYYVKQVYRGHMEIFNRLEVFCVYYLAQNIAKGLIISVTVWSIPSIAVGLLLWLSG